MTYGKSLLTESQDDPCCLSSPRTGEPACTWIPAFAGMSGKGSAGALRPIVADDLLDLGAEARGDVFTRKRVGDIGGEEADLRAAIEAAALEFQAVEILRARQRDHRVRQLNFAAGAAVLFCQKIENLGLQNVAAGEN